MKKRQPNVLWLMTDEQRRDSLGCYGSPWARTPNLDALASEGAVFDAAVTPAPLCVPARTSILTGDSPTHTGIWHNDVDFHRHIPNLMTHFRESGYRTASFGKQHYVGAGSAFTTEEGPCLSSHVSYFTYADGYDEALYDLVKYPGEKYNWIFGGRFPAPADATAEAEVVAKAMRWLDTDPHEEPFFLRVSFNGPHTPVTPPAPFDQIMPADSITLPIEAESLPEGSPQWLSKELTACSESSVLSREQIQKMRRYYYGEVAYLDSLFGKLLDWMKGRRLLENTIVVYASDHGTHLGDYGLVQKQTFFEPVVNVPFFFWYPSQIVPGHLARPVETRSLFPTLLDLAGFEPAAFSSAKADPAPSLAGCLRTGHEPEPRPVFSEFSLSSFAPHIEHHGRLVMVRDGDWKLSACLDPTVHDVALYNLGDDPFERTNRADAPEDRARRDALLGLIAGHVDGGTVRSST